GATSFRSTGPNPRPGTATASPSWVNRQRNEWFLRSPVRASAPSVTVPANGAFTVTVGTDVAGALGYNVFVSSVGAGPYLYAGRTGYNKATVSAYPAPGTTSTTASAADASAVATNFDGLLTNLAASGGYVSRLNS